LKKIFETHLYGLSSNKVSFSIVHKVNGEK